jgi:hypothetical protein
VLLALVAPLFFMSWQAEAQRRRPVRRPATTATPAATPQTGDAQATPKAQQKINLVRMRGSDTTDGSNVTLESDGVMNKYSAYRKDDRFYVVVPDLDAQRAQSNLRGRGYENVQVQKSGNDTVLVFRLQPGAKASVRQRFNRLDVVFNTPGGATNNQGNANQTQSTPTTNANQGGTRTTQTQGGATITQPNNVGTTGGSITPPNNPQGSQNPNINPYNSGTVPVINAAPPPDGGLAPTPVESPAASPEATPPPEQIAQATEAPAAGPPATTTQQPSSTSSSFAATLARNWGLALIIGLVLVSLGLVVAARARSRRDAPAGEVKERTLAETPPPLVTRKPKVVPAATTTAASTAAAVLKKTEREKARTAEKKTTDESTVEATPAKEVSQEVVSDKGAAKDVFPVTTGDIESASAEVKKLLAGESYDEAVVGTHDKGTRQAVVAELLSGLASRNPERRERARTAFVKHNYLDEATYDLRTAEAPAERASAARALGFSQDNTATPHLVAALEDTSPEVRRAVIEALAELRDPSAVGPLEALLKTERDRKVPHNLIQRAIEASTIAVAVEPKEETQEETTTLEAAAPALEEQAQAISDSKETPTVETMPAEAAPVVTEADEVTAIETAAVASEADVLSSVEATPVKTDAGISIPRSVEIVTPPQRSGSRKVRKKQARQKRADEQARKLAEMQSARQEEQSAAAQAAAAAAEAARLLAEEQQRQRAQEEEARQQEEARRQEEARQAAEAEAQRLEAEAQRQAEEEAARLRAEAEARRQAEEEEARLKAEEETARLRAEEEARQRAEEEAQRRAEEEERQRAEAEAQRRAEEEAARLRAEEEERRQAEEARQRAEAARIEAEAEAARLRAEEERRRAEEERRRVEEEARLQAEAEERRRVEEERLRLEAEAARVREEEEARQREAEERQRVEAEARARREEEARLQAEEEARKQAEEEARLKAEAEAQRKAEEEAARLRAEAARARAEEEARQLAEAEARRLEEEAAARQRAEEEARRLAEEEAQRQAEEEARQRALEEAARLRAEEEEAARLRAEEEAARLLAEEEARRLAAEEEARRAAEEVETVQVTEADVITPDAPHVSPAELLIERNDGSDARWFDIEVGQAEASPVSPMTSELSSVAPDAATSEWQMGEPQAPVHASVASSEIEVAEEAQAEAPKGIDIAITEKGIAEPSEEFSTVPSSILRRLGSEDSSERAEAVADLGRLGGDDAFRSISAAFDDPSQEVRNAAARSLFELSTDRAASFTRALREAPLSRRRNIGASLASSGLAGEAISHLMGESREKTYDAFSLLFLMSKAGEVQPLMRAIEEHPNNEVRLAVVKLLALSGQQEILPAFRRLAVRGSLPTEVRSAVMEAIYQISSQAPSDASTRV